jgi:hypothetical protein
VTITAFAGMVNVVFALLGLDNVTPIVVQSTNCCPLGGVPAPMVTVLPAAKLPRFVSFIVTV